MQNDLDVYELTRKRRSVRRYGTAHIDDYPGGKTTGIFHNNISLTKRKQNANTGTL